MDIRYEKKCTLIANFLEFCKEINTPVDLVLALIRFYLNTEGSLTEEKFLKLKGTYDTNIIKNVLMSISSLQKDTRIFKDLFLK